MRHILFVGIGQTGATAAELFLNQIHKYGIFAKALAIDTDESVLREITAAQTVSMADDVRLSTVVEELGEDRVESYFPCRWEEDQSAFLKGLDMNRGSNLWRMKAFLSFAAFLEKENRVAKLHAALDEMVAACGEEGTIELCTVASLAGGTGSALFLPVTFYIKQYLKSIGGSVSASNAFFAMPDIYKETFTAEQGLKSYANAYAALRELNAVNLTVFSKDHGEAENAPAVDFRIVVPGGAFRTLFDSDEEEFRTPEAAPFDQVVLFEKIPTVGSVATHIGVLTDAVVSSCVCRTTPNQKTTDAIVGSISLVRVNYPVDCIVKYIAKEQLYAFISKEMKEVGEAVERYALGRRKMAQNEKKMIPDTVEVYRDDYIAAVEAILARNGGAAETLIGREADFLRTENTVDLYDTLWEDSLDHMVEESVCGEEMKAIGQLLSQHAPKEEPPVKKSIFKKKAPAPVVDLDVNEILPQVREWLSGAYAFGRSALTEQEGAFEEALVSQREDAEFSLTRDLLRENGVFLHPIYALFKLCVAHRTLASHKTEPCAISEESLGKAWFPKCVLRVAGADEKSKYARCGERRLERLLALAQEEPNGQTDESETAEKEVVADDAALFLRDLHGVYGKLRESFKHYRYQTVLRLLETLILRYRDLLQTILREKETVLSDLQLALLNGSVCNATTVNVGASAEEKRNLYGEYEAAYAEDRQGIAANDASIAEWTASLALSDLHNSDVSREDVLALLEEIESGYGAYCQTTKFYQTEIDKHIFDAMKDSMDGRFGVSDFAYSKIFAARYIPLKIGRYGTYGEHRAVSYASGVILSDTMESVEREACDSTAQQSVAKWLEDKMADAGENGVTVSFVRGMDSRELLVYRETAGLKLSFVEAINELAEDPICYHAYTRANRAIGAYASQMWDSSLSYRREGGAPLPFISPEKQRQYEQSVAKAVLYAFAREELFLDTTEDGETAYFLRSELDRTPLAVDHDPVSEGEIGMLMTWAYRNPSWVSEASAKYDAYVAEGKRSVPANVSCGSYGLKEAAIQRLVLDAFGAPLFSLWSALDREGALDPSGYASWLAEVVNETILRYCIGQEKEFREASALAYNGVLETFFERLSETLGREPAVRYADWLNSQGLFLRYTSYNTFCEFTFEED